MEAFMDAIWMKMLALVFYIKGLLDGAFSPLNDLGPAGVILIIALVTVILTKFLSRIYKTKRYRILKKEFEYWYNLRQEALKCEDKEKAGLLAKNIDQAKLNRVYYDYFFEGLLGNILTQYLPILIFAAYINESYNPERLMTLFGRDYVFRITYFSREPVLMGGIFWFVLSLVGLYLLWYVIRKGVLRYKSNPSEGPAGNMPPKIFQSGNQTMAG